MPRQSWRKGTQCAENQNFVRVSNFYKKVSLKVNEVFAPKNEGKMRLWMND